MHLQESHYLISCFKNKITKLKILKDDPVSMPPPPKGHRDTQSKDKTIRCGQCERKLAFVVSLDFMNFLRSIT